MPKELFRRLNTIRFAFERAIFEHSVHVTAQNGKHG